MLSLQVLCLTLTGLSNDCKTLTLEMDRKLHELHAMDKETLTSSGKLPFNDGRNNMAE